MATLRPFAALRPRPEVADRVCELPYDVMSTAEARALAAGNELSFLRVSKPEIGLPVGADPCSPGAYELGKSEFKRLINTGALRQDPQPCFYLYRQVMGGHSQTGLVAVASCKEYLNGGIRKHELTRPDKEDDRVRHIEALNAQTGPVFLTYRAMPEVDDVIERLASEAPAIDFTAPDGVRHTSWVVVEPTTQDFLQNQFENIPRLYIADGHHRSAAAARVFEARRGTGHSAWFLAVIFPHNRLRILPYNRVLRDLNGLTAAQFLEKLEAVFEIGSGDRRPEPQGRHEVGLYLAGRWHLLAFRDSLTSSAQAYDTLDVSLLQDHVLRPMLKIEDPRTSDRIRFVGGIRGAAELEKLVDSGEYACAFSMHPTSIDDLMTIADEHRMMPPKSTWFEPKLRDAMFCHLI